MGLRAWFSDLVYPPSRRWKRVWEDHLSPSTIAGGVVSTPLRTDVFRALHVRHAAGH